MLKKLLIALLVIGAIAGGALYYVSHSPTFTVELPDYQKPGELVQLQQGWSDAQRVQFHYTSQGTRLVPYRWLMALEQPCFSLGACDSFVEPQYLGRFGFLAGTADPNLNPGNLPVGFAYQKDFFDPTTGQTGEAVGLTCAACHTGELYYGKYAVRVDGAPAMVDVTAFQKALGLSVVFTKYVPFRYARFEDKVLGANASDADKAKLKAAFNGFLDAAKAEVATTDKLNIYPHSAGFIRTDALTRIGNQVFAVDMKVGANFAVANAPVRFPQIWDASWFNWVQYNSSISDPTVRNVGEALGVRAMLKAYGPDANKFENSVHIEGLRTLEGLLRGDAPYKGLTSPAWPSVFPAIDKAKADKGAALYKQHCQGCHFPSIPELVADLNSPKPLYWGSSEGNKYLMVNDIPVDKVATDPHEAMDFIARTADTGDLKLGRLSAALGLQTVTEAIASKFYTRAGYTTEQGNAQNGYKDPNYKPVRALPIYKARPLNGIWAVAPYLHNGSVPNLDLLLSEQKERPAKFYLGTRTYDPVKVGYDYSALKGGYEFDVTLPGNSNAGHEFTNDKSKKGVLGPALSAEDRAALIEYLKTL